MLIYDIEIVKAIAGKSPEIPGIEYCEGWHDHANMGVSVIGVIDYEAKQSRVFCADNFSEFAALVEVHDIVAGFNNIPFDNAVLRASGVCDIPEEKSYDLLREIWLAAGLSKDFQYPSHAGYGLDAVSKANGFIGKSGNGAIAPVDWQQGKIGSVIDYCLQDVFITAQLIDHVRAQGYLTCPKTGKPLGVRFP